MDDPTTNTYRKTQADGYDWMTHLIRFNRGVGFPICVARPCPSRKSYPRVAMMQPDRTGVAAILVNHSFRDSPRARRRRRIRPELWTGAAAADFYLA
jgi:hypothetical protein